MAATCRPERVTSATAGMRPELGALTEEPAAEPPA